jgi:hypothetical protein
MTGPNGPALTQGTGAVAATPTRDKEMACRFLAGLDPNATRFTFQLFNDSGSGGAQIFHGTLDELWPKVLALNTPQGGVGVFVVVAETDLQGRRAENIVRTRALFADADGKQQVASCASVLKTCGVSPSMVVNSGRGAHVYFCTDVPLQQFSSLQKQLSVKLGTDGAVKDLPRVMRLPGTLHLKDPVNPRLVKLVVSEDEPVQRWLLPDLISKLGLSFEAAVEGATQADVMSSGDVTQQSPNLASGDHVSGDVTIPADVLRQKPAAEFASIKEESLASGIKLSWFGQLSPEEKDEAVDYALGIIAERTNILKLTADGGDNLQYYTITTAVAVSGAPHAEDIFVKYASAVENADSDDVLREHFARCRRDADGRISVGTLILLGFQAGGDFSRWKHQAPGIPALPPVAWCADELRVSFADIPHRRWLYGVDLVRGDITLIGSPGGAGKTSLAIGMAVAIGTGRRLLEEKIFGGEGLKVLYINAEDSSVEMKRRLWAFCRKHNVAEQDLARLYVAGTEDPRVQRLSFLRTTDKSTTVDQVGFKQLEDLLDTLQPDLVVLDPLVSLCGGGNINDNAAMSLVMRDIKRLAIKHDCAVLIIHHTKKGGDLTNAEAISGASAIVNLARHAIMTVTMTKEEAGKAGVLPSERYRYFKAIDAKSNLAPRSGDSPWYELCSEELPNAEPPIYPHGDRVQAVVRVNLAVLGSAPAADDPKIRRAILDVVQRGKTIESQSYPYSPSPAGATNKRPLLEDAMNAVATATLPRSWQSDDLKAVTERAITDMKSDGWLVEYDIPESAKRFRRGRALRVDWSKTPWEANGGADGS